MRIKTLLAAVSLTALAACATQPPTADLSPAASAPAGGGQGARWGVGGPRGGRAGGGAPGQPPVRARRPDARPSPARGKGGGRAP